MRYLASSSLYVNISEKVYMWSWRGSLERYISKNSDDDLCVTSIDDSYVVIRPNELNKFDCGPNGSDYKPIGSLASSGGKAT